MLICTRNSKLLYRTPDLGLERNQNYILYYMYMYMHVGVLHVHYKTRSVTDTKFFIGMFYGKINVVIHNYVISYYFKSQILRNSSKIYSFTRYRGIGTKRCYLQNVLYAFNAFCRRFFTT